jgi:FMN reductase (NADPH)/FMN reductase [NAD(P)H]
MKNETLETIARRRSVRAYADQPLTQADKDTILQATLRAPTAGNMMLYSIIEIEDQALKDRLAVTCDNQPFIASAPYVLLFAADYQRWFDLYLYDHAPERCIELGGQPRTPEEGDLMLAVCDTLIAAQTAVIAAESLGIGSCYIGDILEQYETHRELLDLPKYVLPITMLCFGYPKQDLSQMNLVPRFDRQFIVHKNAYHRLDQAELKQMVQPIEDRVQGRYVPNANNLGQSSYLRKFVADFSVEMSRSVREMIRSWCAPE